MGLTWRLSASLAKYVFRMGLRGMKRFPYVLMLEPLFRCNLSCSGCGRIREYRDHMKKILSVSDCLSAVHEADAPVVSITGGEPLIHPGIAEIVGEILDERRFVNLCTNGLLLQEALDRFTPGHRFSFVLHLDGMAPRHDAFAGRAGVFDTVVSGIRAAKRAGFRVLINCTIYRATDLSELQQLFELLVDLGVDGVMVSPAFSYEAVGDDVFLTRDEITEEFRSIFALAAGIPYYNSPIYLEFLAGDRDLQCSPWSTPTRNPVGWKKPCYLITDDHCATFRELLEETQWEKYGVGNDRRCANCMVHCGFEASALSHGGKGVRDLLRLARWAFSSGF